MKKYKRIFAIVVDSFGFGTAPDSHLFNDEGADTVGHIAEACGGISLPHLEKFGAGNLRPIKGVKPRQDTQGYYLKMQESSVGKDTMTGHWELMGLYIDEPFITFTETGFPDELIKTLEEKTGHRVIGNKAASGTEILDELGEEHLKTKAMIVYTSADSVLQIAAHEEVFGLDELIRCCEIAREITMKPEWKVGRVIARPFIGNQKGSFQRTPNRRDYALEPFGDTVLDALKEKHLDVIAVGKISDIFVNKGITESHKSKSSVHGMEQTIEIADKDFTGLCFVNLVDFDAKWGHRRDPQGYKQELESFDALLGQLKAKMKDDDLLIVTADHGNDPTWTGTDHTREVVPLFMYSPSMQATAMLDTSETFSDLGATIADNFDAKMPEYGKSLLSYLK